MTGDQPGPAPLAVDPPRARRRSVRWIVVAAGVPLLGVLGVLATRPPAATPAAQSPLLGKPAPALTAQSLEGQTLRLADYQGRWVLVNFFATWCVPCRKEHPELIAFRQRHRATGDAEVLGVVYADSADAVRSFRADHGGEWPMLVDPSMRIALDFGVAGVPESFLINPAGTVVSRIVGGVRAPDLEDVLARAKSPPS